MTKQLANLKVTTADPLLDSLKSTLSPRVQETLIKRVCTFTGTGTTHEKQYVYRCKTCKLDPPNGGKGCCIVCKSICHQGHEVSDTPEFSTFYCDCPGERLCKCLTPAASEGATTKPHLLESVKSTLSPRVQEALIKKACTFTGTGANLEKQYVYRCKTCKLDTPNGDKGCCIVCKSICHQGHEVSDTAEYLNFYCDCPGEKFCKCLSP